MHGIGYPNGWMMALPRDELKCQHWLDAANWNVKASDFPTAEQNGAYLKCINL